MLAPPEYSLIHSDPATAWFTASWSKFHSRSRGVSDCVGICGPEPYELQDDDVPVCASATAGETAITTARPIEAKVLSIVFPSVGRRVIQPRL